jgi:hypothetical protein
MMTEEGTMTQELYTPSFGFIQWLKCHKPATAAALEQLSGLQLALACNIGVSRVRLYIPPAMLEHDGVSDELDRQVDTDRAIMVLSARPDLLGSIPVHRKMEKEDLNGGFGILTAHLRGILGWSTSRQKDTSWLPNTEHTAVEDAEVVEYLVKGKVAGHDVVIDVDELRTSGTTWPIGPPDEKKSTSGESNA